ncbi:transposable element Tcb2 transposase [Trichonephila clavipes]|nr:transposable element Tcb2 transposase [Trichonephila clavipes]
MSQRSLLTDSEAWRVVGRLEGGQTQAEVAQAIGVSQSVISRIWNRFLETGSADRRPGQGHRDEILIPISVPYAAAIGDDFILMDDKCRPHHANLVEDFIFEEGIVRMEWPACSPNMNLIEHVWDALGRQVAGRQPPPQTLQELERALLEEWDRIPPPRD